MSTYQSKFFGVDRDVIEDITRKARRDRAKAMRDMVSSLFSSVTDCPQRETVTDADVAACAGKVAHT